MSPGTSPGAEVESDIMELFAAADAEGFVHVREIGLPLGINVGADTPVVLASVVKILIAVAYARAVDSGNLDPQERVVVPARLQVGGTGTAGCSDPVEMSLADLALFMMSMSDNAVTDIIIDRVGHPAILQVIVDLDLHRTRWVADMDTLHRQVAAELNLPTTVNLDAQVDATAGERVRALSWIDPARTNHSTPRDIGVLLEAIWTDRAGPPPACGLIRELMSHQVTGHRLAAGFDDPVTVRSKTGTVPSVRNDAGVLTYPDGRAYVAAVFTRARTLADRQPRIDTAIGQAARIAVDRLRQLNRKTTEDVSTSR